MNAIDNFILLAALIAIALLTIVPVAMYLVIIFGGELLARIRKYLSTKI